MNCALLFFNVVNMKFIQAEFWCEGIFQIDKYGENNEVHLFFIIHSNFF